VSKRLAILIAIGVAGGGLIWLYPPTIGMERGWVVDATSTDDEDVITLAVSQEPTDTWDAGPDWRWNLPTQRGGTYLCPLFVRDVDRPKIAAMWGLWAGIVLIAVYSPRILMGVLSRPVSAVMNAIALLAAGFAITNTLLGAIVIFVRGGWVSDRLLTGDVYLLLRYGWGYGWPIVIAIGAWVASVLVAGAKHNRTATHGLEMAWLKNIRQWPQNVGADICG